LTHRDAGGNTVAERLEEGHYCRVSIIKSSLYTLFCTLRFGGRLEHVTHEHGLPGLDSDSHDLLPVSSFDIQSGLVSVAQNELVSLGVFEFLPYLLTDEQVISELKQKG
jgi:hypothetical protein